jgi:hypothetical protein
MGGRSRLSKLASSEQVVYRSRGDAPNSETLRFGLWRYSAVRYSAVRYSAVRYSAVRYSAVRHLWRTFAVCRYNSEVAISMHSRLKACHHFNTTLSIHNPVAGGRSPFHIFRLVISRAFQGAHHGLVSMSDQGPRQSPRDDETTNRLRTNSYLPTLSYRRLYLYFFKFGAF